nr:MAG TPA: hypothetical protein [Caudoviricetes sp.]DAM26756.1 MAG TPA: hypothetical protein [Caudoviricetes sp.]
MFVFLTGMLLSFTQITPSPRCTKRGREPV